MDEMLTMPEGRLELLPLGKIYNNTVLLSLVPVFMGHDKRPRAMKKICKYCNRTEPTMTLREVTVAEITVTRLRKMVRDLILEAEALEASVPGRPRSGRNIFTDFHLVDCSQ